jgi:hypothetical protein
MPEIPQSPEELPISDAAAEMAEAAPSEQGGSPETAHVLESLKEHEPMLDVHMPHATHTWKDFLIHLGTITAGLLIAISLEQSVEKLHHLHQRHELEASLRAEGEMNKKRAEADLARYDDEMTWMLGLHEDIGKMMATGGKANLPYRAIHETPLVVDGSPYYGRSLAMMTAVWDTAGADNRLALLPDELAHGYSLLYHIRGERFAVLRSRASDVWDAQGAFEALFADIGTPTTPVLTRMSTADLKQYDALVMQSFTAAGAAKEQLRLVYATDQAMLQGLYDGASATRLLAEARARFKDDYEKMAQKIEAEDAARDGAAAKPMEKSK